VKFGVSFGALYASVAEVARLGVEAERGGFESLWVPDSPMLYRDPYAALALLARDTRRARLGTLATNPLTRHPAATASAILTVHELSGGRTLLGLATGDSAVRRIGARPVRTDELGATVRQLRALLAGEALAFDTGRFGIRFAQPPSQQPAPPVYVVATGWRVLEVAGGVADGVILNVGLDPRLLAAARERVHAGARTAGRDPAALELIPFAFCAIDADGVTARARLKPSVSWLCQRFPGLAELAGLPLAPAVRQELARFAADYARYDLVHAAEWARAMRDAAFLPAEYVEALALGGRPAEVVGRVRELASLGFQSVLIRPPSHEDWWPTVRACVADVLPAFR